MEAFDYKLQDGDRVEVIVKKTAKPKRQWLDTAATSHARNKIRAQLNRAAREDSALRST